MDKNAYLELLEPIVNEHRKHNHSFWLPYLSGEVITLEVTSPDGTQCCVEINAFWDDKPEGDIRVIASIDDGGWRAFVPVADSFIIAPDGSFVGE